MKRYWKLISIVVLIVLTIGTFYIQQSTAESSYPQFVIETQSGDESEIKALEIDAAYRMNSLWASLLLTLEGSDYRQDLSIVSQVFDRYHEPEIRRLQDEYRNFMRGKAEIPAWFYEDESRLIYVDISNKTGLNGYEPKDFTFEIEVLDKDTKDKTAFKVPVPDEHLYYYVDVVDVQYVNGELVVATRNHIHANDHFQYKDYDTAIHLYTFDIAGEKLINKESIEFSMEIKENRYVMNMYTLNNEDQMGSNPFIVFASEIGEERLTQDGVHEMHSFEPVELQVGVYNIETKEQFELDLAEVVTEGYRPEVMRDNQVYFMKNSGSQLEIIRYNVETKEVKVKQTFDIPSIPMDMYGELGGIPEGHSFIRDHKVYYISTLKTEEVDATVFVGDIDTGELLYEGSIEIEPNSLSPGSKYQLELYYGRLK